MTEVAVDRKVTPREESLVDALSAANEANKRLREAIAAELAEKLPGYEQDQTGAAAVLEKAYADAQPLERDAADIAAKIASTEGERATRLAVLETGDVAERVDARRWVEEYDNELVSLREKQDFITAQLLPLRDAVTKAHRGLEAADSTLAGAWLNATPELAYYGAGQKTAAYTLMRFGLGLEAALRDEGHPEHDAAVDHMLHLCRTSGFRTEDFPNELPSDALMAKRFWDDVYANASRPEPAPGPSEVVKLLAAEMENNALQS